MIEVIFICGDHSHHPADELLMAMSLKEAARDVDQTEDDES